MPGRPQTSGRSGGNILRDDLIALTDVPPPRPTIRSNCAASRPWSKWTANTVEMIFLTNNLDWSAQHRRPVSLPLGASKSSSRNSNRPCNWPTSSATTPTPCAGRSGRRCWSMCCCASGLPEPMGPQLHPALCPGPFGPVAKMGCASLLDAMGQPTAAAAFWHATTSLFAGFGINLWDSPANEP